ncbi:unnamed protein product [Orchesella dallaii]|uniref:DUF243 domain-containing protein n=1 Tax=Orchesella dallaii TaxID=48710 RepID=A0ABP1RHZ2_9HEXA
MSYGRVKRVIASILGVAYAGVGHLSPSEEADALQLFHKICSGYGSEGAGQDLGWTRVYCKKASGVITESQNHMVKVPGQSGQAQTVFVQPPPARYHHKVEIVSDGGQGGQTKIYVLPQTATHTVHAKGHIKPGTQVKPVVYFLKGGSSSNPGGYGPPQQPSPPEYGPPAVLPPPQQPSPPEYGPPAAFPLPEKHEPLPPSNYGPPAKQPHPPSYGPPPPPTKPPHHGYGSPSKLPPSSYVYPTEVISSGYGR